MNDYKLYIFDLDGTLFRGGQPTRGAVDAVERLRHKGAEIRFLTNNSGRTREFLADKLRKMGFEAKAEDFHTSATGTAVWMARQGLSSAYVVGEEGLYVALGDQAIQIVNRADEQGPQADAVVAGICRSITYGSLNSAMQQILGGARFVATNRDATYPLEEGRLEPGAGAVVAAIEACSGIKPFVIGKPNPYLIRLILEETGLRPEDALVIGDRLETDIEAGRAAGCDTLLTLTGVTETAPAGQAVIADLRELAI